MDITEEQLKNIISTAVKEALTEERKFWFLLLDVLVPEYDWEKLSQEAYEQRNKDWFTDRPDYTKDLLIP